MNPIRLGLFGLLCLTPLACDAPTPSDELDNETLSKQEARLLFESKADRADYCEVFDWYGDGVCDTFCLDPDPDCEDQPVASDDPFDPASCLGVHNMDDIIGLFEPGASSATLGRYTLYGRSRECSNVTGCSPWSDEIWVEGEGEVRLDVVGDNIVLHWEEDPCPGIVSGGQEGCGVSSDRLVCHGYKQMYPAGNGCWTKELGPLPTWPGKYSGKLTSDCLRIEFPFYETAEYVLLGRFD